MCCCGEFQLAHGPAALGKVGHSIKIKSSKKKTPYWVYLKHQTYRGHVSLIHP